MHIIFLSAQKEEDIDLEEFLTDSYTRRMKEVNKRAGNDTGVLKGLHSEAKSGGGVGTSEIYRFQGFLGPKGC